MKTFLRRLEILNYLKSRHQATGTDTILHHLVDAGYINNDESTERSQLRLIQRDLLFLLGPEDEEGDRDNDFGLSLERGLSKSLHWSLDPYQQLNYDFEKMPAFMALALSVTEKHLKQVLPSTTQKELTQVFQNAEVKLQKSERKLSPKHYHRLTKAVEFFQRGQTLQTPEFDMRHLDKIYQAILRGKRVTVQYRGARGSKAYELHPFGVAIMLPKLYLVGKKHDDILSQDDDSFRSFLIHKIESVEISLHSNLVPGDFELKTYLDEGNMDVLLEARDRTNYPLQLELRVSDNVNLLSDLRESPLSTDQTLSKRKAGIWVLEAKVRRTIQLKNWLLSLGATATVIAPEIIRDDLIQALDAMRENYESHKS